MQTTILVVEHDPLHTKLLTFVLNDAGCKQLKLQHPDIPVVLLSTHETTDDLIKGFDQGADDYLVRPYEPAELLVRIRAVLRRYRRVERSRYGVLVEAGNTSLDLGRLTFRSPSGRTVLVTPTEMRLLECLMGNAETAVSRETLIAQTWAYEADNSDNRVDVYIRRLRHKIEAHPKDRNLIRTIRGVGYVFDGTQVETQQSA